ncbi:MAG: DUF222 domain-containing protein [Angustibacter sp.]
MTNRADGGGALALDAVLSDLDDALDRLSDLPLWQLRDAALKTVAAALDRARRRTDGQTIRLLGEVDGRGIPGLDGTKTAGNWLLSVVPDLKPGQAGALGNRAEKLYRSALSPELAPTREAVEAGALLAPQERLVVETVEQLTPPNLPADHPDAVSSDVIAQAQQLLVEYAPVLSSRDFDRLVTELRHTLDPRADDRLARDEKAQQRRRNFVMVTDASGMTFVEGLLTKECGAALKAALDAWSAPMPAEDGTLDPRSPGQRRHDALQHLAETALATDKVPTSHGSPTRVIVRVTAETLAAAAADDLAAMSGCAEAAASAATAETLPAGRGVPGSRRGASPGEQSAEGARRPAPPAHRPSSKTAPRSARSCWRSSCARRSSSPCWSTAWATRSTSAAPCACTRPDSASPSPNATAAAPGSTAPHQPRGAKPTTSPPGRPEATPTSTTQPCSADATTATPTPPTRKAESSTDASSGTRDHPARPDQNHHRHPTSSPTW